MHEGPVVVFSGGGTGGHLYPALAIADALRARRPDVRALFVGSRRGIEGRILAERGEWHFLLPVQGIDRAHPFRSLLGAGSTLGSIVRAVALLRRIQPGAVVVTGGYAGAPAGIAAALTGTPLLLQEQNAVPGLVTKLLTRFAARIHVAFPEAVERLPAGRDAARVTGNPVRPPSDLDAHRARERLGLPTEGPVLLVVGGSQGSLALNRVLLEALAGVASDPSLRPRSLSVLWATGPAHHDGIAAGLAELGEVASWVHTLPYIEDMPVALAAADLALARAGAMFTAELLVEGLPAMLVPLPSSAEDHQLRNAESLAAAGAAVVLPQGTLTAPRLWETVRALVETPGRLDEMRASTHALARPDAAVALAASVNDLLPPTREAA